MNSYKIEDKDRFEMSSEEIYSNSPVATSSGTSNGPSTPLQAFQQSQQNALVIILKLFFETILIMQFCYDWKC